MLSKDGIDAYWTLWPHFSVDMTLIAAGLLLTLLVLRYWIAWMATGAKPRQFSLNQIALIQNKHGQK